MKKTSTYLLIGLIIGAIGGLAFYFTRREQVPSNGESEVVVLSPSPNQGFETSPSPQTQTSLRTGEASPTPAAEGWQVYQSSEHEFSIQHPSEMEISQTARDAVEFMLLGPSQEPNTELFDGIRLTFLSGERNQDLESFVQEQRQEQLDQPTTEEVTEKTSVSLAGFQGFEYTVTGPFGDIRYVFLPAGEDEYLEISEAVYDPTGQGFQQTVESMYQTLMVRNQN